MEEWEQMIDGYEAEHDVKTFIKMLKTAEVVLKQDLALFESEWIISTLFFKPVNLLGTISLKLNDTPWSKPIGDAFKLIAVIVEKYLPDQLYEHIVTLCLLPYSPLIRKEALVCLTQVVRVSAEGARDAPRLVSELEDMLNCKTQLAVLVGAICEHHPEVVADSATRIWRIYLNSLDSNKNTDTVTQSVLQGLLSLFKHFGTELPIIEFRDLYEKITKEYIQKGKCREVCLSILERHSNLFKELLSQDVKLRSLLWSLRASPALTAVYETVATAVNKEQLQKIVQTELLPRTHSNHSQLKFTSLRILRFLTTNHGVEAVKTDEDVLALEQEVKMGKVSNNAADAMLWCIESNALYSEKLLQAAVLFHNNIPVAKRREIVVHGLLNANEEVRIATVTLLINECCQQTDGNTTIDTYLPLWRDIFDAKNGTDSVVLENSRLVFGDFMEHLFMVLEAAVEEEGEQPPQKLSPLFTLTHHILTFHPCEDSHGSRLSHALRELAARFALSAGLLCVCWTFGEEESVRKICKMVRLDKCRDEALLCESCNLLIHAPEQDVDCRDVLMAIEILLTRKDVVPKILSQTLQRLESLIERSDVDENKLNRLLFLVEKLRMRKDMTGKEARILHRDVILFMGKYVNNNYTANKLSDTSMIAELKDKLVLNVPNPDEGSTYKLNLQTILQLAITHEDADALQKILSIICATLSTSKDASLQLSLTAITRALCRAHAHACDVDAASVQHAVLLCDSVACLTACIAVSVATVDASLQLSLTAITRALCRAHAHACDVDAASVQHAVLLCDSVACLTACIAVSVATVDASLQLSLTAITRALCRAHAHACDVDAASVQHAVLLCDSVACLTACIAVSVATVDASLQLSLTAITRALCRAHAHACDVDAASVQHAVLLCDSVACLTACIAVSVATVDASLQLSLTAITRALCRAHAHACDVDAASVQHAVLLCDSVACLTACIAVSVATVDASLQLSLTAITRALCRAHAHACDVDAASVQHAVLLCDSVACLTACIAVSVATVDASLQLSLTAITRALCRAHAHACDVDAASVQHAVLLCDSVACLTACIAVSVATVDASLQLSLTAITRALCRAHAHACDVDAASVQHTVLLCDSVACLTACIAVSVATVDASLQLSLTAITRALCRAHAHACDVDAASVQHAVLLCDSVACLTACIAYISEEKSPGVRKMLSDALEGLLLKDPGSEATEQLVKVAAEHAAVMMASSDVTVRSGGLNITDTLLSALKDNHLLLTKELPNLLTLILESEDLDSKTTFKTAYKLLIDNFELFTNKNIDNIVETLNKNLLKNNEDLSGEIERKIFKDKVKSTFEFFREIRDLDFRKLLSHYKLKLNFDVEMYLIAESGLLTNEVLEKVLTKIADLDVKCEGRDIFTVEAILKFLEVNAKPLLDEKKEVTMQALGKIISSLTPDYILNLIRQIRSCITIYTEILEEPNTFTDDFQNWFQKFEIKHVIESIDKFNIQRDEAKVLKSLNLYLQLLNIPSLACDDELLNLNDVAFEIYVQNGEKYIETYKECLLDMLQISLRYKSQEEFKLYIRKSFDMVELKFLKYFILVFSDFLLQKPYVLLEKEMKPICVILNDIVKSSLKKKCSEDDGIRILELVNALWPAYEEQATFESKHALLMLTTRLPLQLSCDSAAMRWAAKVVGEGGREERVRLVGVLPGGEECSSAYRSFASQLPVRVSEMSGADRSALQALIDACADTADNALLDVIMKLADCNQSKGWWDEAMASAMAALARRGDCRLPRLKVGAGDAVVETREVSLMSIAMSLFEFPSTGVSKKLLVPLLRYSSSSFCEKFYASIINKLLASLSKWVRESERDNRELRRCLSEHAKALTLITLAFEKIPLQSLKSPDSLLYSEVPNKQPSYLMKRASVLCLKLRDQACPEDASVELKEYYREFQASIYKCLCAAICITRPAAKLYDYLFSAPVWEKLFDCDAVRELPLRTQWTQQKSVHTVADVSAGSASRPSGTTGNTRTRIFLRTLSENPLQFDLMDVDEEPPENSHELELVVNELNCQDCADTLTALLRHAASLTHTGWLDKVAEALRGESHRNVKWTLAQMIVNCKEELKPHAITLRPPLLALIADTPREFNGRKLLNNLHVDVLETILYWKDLPDLPESSINNLNSTIEYLTNTCIDNDQYASLHSSLVNLLQRLVEVYGERLVVPWTCFEGFISVPDKLKTLQRILITITKNKINIPELLPTLVKLEEKLWAGNTKLSELFGLALACGSEIDRPLAQYRHFLDRKRQNDVREYVQLLYYAQMGYPRVCDEFNFKKIIDLTPKVSGPIKSKCLRIISTYMSHSRTSDSTSILENLDLCSLLHEVPLEAMKVVEGLTLGGRLGRAVSAVILPYVGHSDVKLRSQAVMVLLKAFEDLFSPKQNEPSAKRSKLNSSKLLSTLESPDTYTSQVIQCVALGVTDTDTSIASVARDRVAACLNSEDMKIRLAEAFLISIGIPATVTSKNRSLPVCVSAFLDILFKRLRAQERFKEAKLRDEPLEIRDPSAMATKLLTNTRTYQGTFLSSMGRRPRNRQAASSMGIDVQIPIDSILESLITLAKELPDVAQALCVEVSKSILSVGRGFDPGASLSRQICDVLSAAAGDVTPLTVGVARLMVENVGKQLDFESCLVKLRQATRCTEGENLVQLLYEEVRMRQDSDIFQLGTVFDDRGTSMEVDYESSLEDIMSAFGKLSNWDRLTEQQKKEASSSGIPQLWVAEDTFRSWLDDYQVVNTKSWFDKLLSACRDESKQDSLRWLRETDIWPRKHFDISVVTEAIERQDWSEGEMKSSCEIRPSDCLVEWAARLMLRRAFPGANDNESSDVTSPSLANELEWCRTANERGLPRLALNCVEVNGSTLQTSDGIPWQIEKACAMRSIGLETKDVEMLGDALAVLDFKVTQLNECSKNDIILMNRLTTALHHDLGSLSKNNLKNIIETTKKYTDRQHCSVKNKEMLCQLYEMAISYYDDVWTKDPSEQNDVLNSMADILGHVVDLNLAKAEMFLAVIFNRLDDFKASMDDVTARNLLVKISSLIQNLDDTSLAQIKCHSSLFPQSILEEFSSITSVLSMGDSEYTYRQQLRLVCDARHSLLRRCSMLNNCVGDPMAWKKTFDLLKESIFENPFAGISTEYNVLKKYKKDLYEIEDYESTDSKQKSSILKKTLQELLQKTPARASLRLSQLCPALAKYNHNTSERDGSLSRLLKLGKLGVVKFYEQVSVFCDAETRPVVLTALLTDGSTRRFIHKTGDRLRVDASAQRVAAAFANLCGGRVVGYSVTPLGEDGGLIEFVENTTRLRALINSEFDLDNVDIGARAEDEELILASSSLEHHKNFCQQVPAYALRSAIEANCSSTEDFINKKQMFLETLSSITMLSWLFGLGDRHLENILYSITYGALCCVDWTAIFLCGVRELPPARLTRNLLAVCHLQELEARLQNLVKSLRASHKLFLNVLKVSFKWMGEEFFSKFPYIEQYARGLATSRDVTRQALLASTRRYKERLVKLLDETFTDLEVKDQYSVVEQVTCLLRQCTDPRILSVTRSGWEPWV